MTSAEINCKCGNAPELVGGNVIYPHRPDLYEKYFYLCRPCWAYVGCHPGTTKPLGTVADADTRKARHEAHAAFDPLWKFDRKYSRFKLYKKLANYLGIKVDDCHIGMFDIETCKKVLEFSYEEREYERD